MVGGRPFVKLLTLRKMPSIDGDIVPCFFFLCRFFTAKQGPLAQSLFVYPVQYVNVDQPKYLFRSPSKALP